MYRVISCTELFSLGSITIIKLSARWLLSKKAREGQKATTNFSPAGNQNK
jgi:hypothetical protein